VISTKDGTLNIQQIDERSAGLLKNSETKKTVLQLFRKVDDWKLGPLQEARWAHR
jgi:hypothetical protein